MCKLIKKDIHFGQDWSPLNLPYIKELSMYLMEYNSQVYIVGLIHYTEEEKMTEVETAGKCGILE